jgi:hypothetical protein
MMLYLDDDSTAVHLVRLLHADGHDVETPAMAGNAGKKDPAHLLHAIRWGRVLLTHNHEDFKLLHDLVRFVSGHHPGILAVCRDNDPTRDLRPKGIVRAIRRLLAAGMPIPDHLHVLNQWR